MTVSGKYVIIGILAVAFAAAGASWWFRYNATNRVAKLWGRHTTRLIRDAPIVELYQLKPPTEPPPPHQSYRGPVRSARRDISNARGLVHLRNALLEDRNYRWTDSAPPTEIEWYWVLQFRTSPSSQPAELFFSSDWKDISSEVPELRVVSCEPIASGLEEMMGELTR